MQKHTLPTVSVIMPIRNEAHYITRSLEAVLAQDYPCESLEVLIVDGMSDDGTRDTIDGVLERHKAKSPTWPEAGRDYDTGVRSPACPNVRVLDNPAHFVSFALNIGLRQARGSVITLVGGHCEIASDYLRRCVEALQETGADCVGGVMTTVGETLSAQAIALAQSSRFGVGGVAFRTGRRRPGYVDTVVFGSYRREVFDRLGGFDEELVRNQDDEFNYRLAHAGGRIWLDGRITCRYHSRASFSRLWSQYFQYGYWKVRVMQKHPRQMRPRQFAPALFVAAVSVGAIASPFNLYIAETWFAVLALYAIATLAFSSMAARTHGWRYVPLVGISCVVLHFSYGLGFWLGLIRLTRPSKQKLNRKETGKSEIAGVRER
jgi:succinoglycan biosynthesis protein ExoA